MHGVARTVRRSLPAVLLLSAVLSVSVIVGCGDDNNDNSSNNGGGGGGGSTTTSFAGWMANGNETGLMTVTINKAGLAHSRPGSLAPGASVTATGSFLLTGTTTPVALTGTFDDATGVLDLTSGGSSPYTFSGAYDTGPPSNCNGSYTGPNGDGAFATEKGATSSAQVYGGDYHSVLTASAGTFLMAVRGTAIEGVATEDGSDLGQPFTGTLTGLDIEITAPATNGYVLSGEGALDTSANPDHVSGWYAIHPVGGGAAADSGSWSGDFVSAGGTP